MTKDGMNVAKCIFSLNGFLDLLKMPRVKKSKMECILKMENSFG